MPYYLLKVVYCHWMLSANIQSSIWCFGNVNCAERQTCHKGKLQRRPSLKYCHLRLKKVLSSSSKKRKDQQRKKSNKKKESCIKTAEFYFDSNSDDKEIKRTTAGGLQLTTEEKQRFFSEPINTSAATHI